MKPLNKKEEHRQPLINFKDSHSKYTLLEIMGIASVMGGVFLYLIMIHHDVSDLKGDIKALNVHIEHILKGLE